MSVHYKFKSAISYDTITFDGLHISVKELKKAILHQKQIGKNTDFDLQVTNAQTNEEYNDDQTLIPKNTSLIVSRIPLTTQQKKAWERAEQNNQLVLSKQISNLDSHEPDSVKLKGADLLGSNASEEDKINAMMAQSTQEYDPSNFVKIRGGNQYGEVPQNYVCHRCHNPGHWIKNCPNNNTTSDPIDIKKATGIPRGFLVPVDGPSVPGAMLTGSGTFAVPSIDQEAYKQSMKPQKKQETEVEKLIIPEDLLCILCSDLLTDAIMMPCCGTSFCDECIRNALLESEENECPDCHGKEISPETLIPNRYLRNAVNGFKDKTGYSKRIEAVKEKVIPPKEEVSVPQINIEPSPKEEVIIPASTQSPQLDPSVEVPRDEIYQKIAAVGDPIDKTQSNYSSIGTINNVNNSHNHPTFKAQGQSQAQSQGPPVSVSNISRPNNTNVHIPANMQNAYQNTRHAITKSTDSRVTHMPRYNTQSLSIPSHPHMRSCLPVGPADISVPPPPFAHPPPSIQPDVGYNQMQPIHNPPPPGLDRNSSPANASSDEGMHPPESTHHQMDKFENQSGSLQPMLRTGYAPGYYPPPMSTYDPYNIPMDMRNRGYHRGGYSRRPTRGQQMGSNYRPDYRNGGNYINNRRTIDDPLAVFQRILRERDNKRRDMRNRHSMSRSRSRSISRSRSRERSRSLSRSPSRILKHRTRSISRSPLPRNRSITPRRRSRSRSRSPVRKRKKSLSPVKRLPIKSRRRTRSPSRDIQGRRSRSLSLHRRTRSRSRSPVHRNRMSPSPRFRSRSPTFYSSPVRFSNYHREEDNFGPKGSNWRGRGTTWNKGTQQYQQSHRYRGQFDAHYDIGIDRPTDFATNYAQFDPHFAMDPNLVRDWDEIRDKELREREKEKKEEEEKQKKKSKSQSPVKHHKVEKLRQEHKPSPDKNHKESDKKDKGKRKKKKDVDVDKKKKKKNREKKEKDDGKKEDDSNEAEVSKLKVESAVDRGDQEPAAPGTSESPPPFESVAAKEDVKVDNRNDEEDEDEENVADGLYGDLDEAAPVDTSWGDYKRSPETEVGGGGLSLRPELVAVEEKPREPEVLAELPERSKWEVEEDVSATEDKSDGEKQKPNGATDDDVEEHREVGGGVSGQLSVTNEVLKRAENAIFQKTTVIRTLDAGKKTAEKTGDGVAKDKKPVATTSSADASRDNKKPDSAASEKRMSKERRPESGGAKDKKSDGTAAAARERKAETAAAGKDGKKASAADRGDGKKAESASIKDGKKSTSDVPSSSASSRDGRERRRDSSDRRDKKPENGANKKTSSRRDDHGAQSTRGRGDSRDDKRRAALTAADPAETAADSLSTIQREARKSGNSIQITIPTDPVDEGKKTGGGGGSGKEVTVKRISAKDRLGDKVLDDKDDKHYGSKSRSEKRKASRSPVRVHSTLIVPEPLSRKIRARSKSRGRPGDKDRNAKGGDRSAASTAPSGSSSAALHRTSRRDDDKKPSSDHQRKKSTDATRGGGGGGGGRTTVRSSADDKHHHHHHHHRGSQQEQPTKAVGGGGGSKKEADRSDNNKKSSDRNGKKDERRDVTATAVTVAAAAAAAKKSSRPAKEPAEKKERKNRRLESDRDETRNNDEDDEAPDDDAAATVGKKAAKDRDKDKDKETDDSASSSSSSSSSSDSSPVRSKKRKKAKKRKKKKKKKVVVASSSDTDDTDSSESSDGTAGNKHGAKKKKKKEQRKHKTHKKAVKKKKKTKHR